MLNATMVYLRHGCVLTVLSLLLWQPEDYLLHLLSAGNGNATAVELLHHGRLGE